MKKLLLTAIIVALAFGTMQAQNTKKTHAKAKSAKTQKVETPKPPSQEELLKAAAKMAQEKYAFRKVGEYPYNDKLANIDGVIPGWTSAEELIALGAEPAAHGKYDWDGIVCQMNRGIVSSIELKSSMDVPGTWSELGFFDGSLRKSIDEWKQWLIGNGFTLFTSKDYSSTIIATNEKTGLVVMLSGSDSPYEIKVMRDFWVTTATSEENMFSTLFGITPGKTSESDLKRMGFSMPSSEYRFYTKKGLNGGKNVSCYFQYGREAGTLVYHLSIWGQTLPPEWKKGNGEGLMTYKKWMNFLQENGFTIVKNATESHKRTVVARHPSLGVELVIYFDTYTEDPINDQDNPKYVNHYEVKYNYNDN